MRDVTLVILNSLRIKCHIRRPLNKFGQGACNSGRALCNSGRAQASMSRAQHPQK